MTNTNFLVKLNRGGILTPEFVQRIDRTPIRMTTNRKVALLMGKSMAEDAIKSLQNSRCSPELVSVQVAARSDGSVAMLAKCTNPSCSAAFLHLADGRLFRLGTNSLAGSTSKATEYFWLCGDCSGGMSLHLARDGKVVPTGLREALPNRPTLAFVSLNRENGMFLRTVTFLRSSHPRVT
jgi:hypothetical protein